MTASNPQDLATRWGGVLGVAPTSVGHGIWEIALQDGAVRVVPGDRDYLSKYTLIHPDPEACLKRAQSTGLVVDGSSFLFAGVQVEILTD